MEMGIEKGMRQIPYEAPILAIDTGSNKGIDGLMMEIVDAMLRTNSLKYIFI